MANLQVLVNYIEVKTYLIDFRTGSYEIQEAEGVQEGTKIVLHLKTDDRQFSDEETVLCTFLLHCSGIYLAYKLIIFIYLCSDCKKVQ